MTFTLSHDSYVPAALVVFMNFIEALVTPSDDYDM